MHATEAEAPTPAYRLAAAFRQIHRLRMAGLPILHPDLHVAVIGGRDWQGHWLGVLVTPWCMNLVLVPAAGSDLARHREGTRRELDFPAGRFEFLIAPVDGVGHLATCSLFSPMQAFADQAAAEATATAVMEALFEPEAGGDASAAGKVDTRGTPASAGSRGGRMRAWATRPGPSRRDLLRGSFRGD